MSLYTPSAFTTSDRAAVARLMHEHPFATLVTPATPEPFISHLPLLFVPGCEPHGTLIGHMARANPQWRHAADASDLGHGVGVTARDARASRIRRRMRRRARRCACNNVQRRECALARLTPLGSLSPRAGRGSGW